MKDEVEEFLRRVQQMRSEAEQAKGQTARPASQQQAAQQKAQQQAQRQKQQRQPPKQVRPATPPAQRPQPISRPPMEAEIVDAELADSAGRFEQRLRNDMRGTEQIAEHTRHLGEEVDQADEKMQAHLHEVFDHKLGQLKSTGGATSLVTADRTASELTIDQVHVMLRSAQSVRDAIILSEILRRPEW